ncbi:SusC/RagA family TonB-linked outer membrane protein [Algivirga pacifica]|uniref:TonB-dependent receptor n=1 Tax=Algivirga pacifica TaxID=1162670 RepID=A0ABP9D7S6_9BACT
MKMKLLSLIGAMLITFGAWAQDRVVSGQVKEVSGAPLPGVNIRIDGTSTGTTTDFDGKFTLKVGDDAVLVFSYVGYVSQKVIVGNKTTFNVALEADTEQLEEVVVTAMGIERSAESLTYSTQEVKAEELTNVKDPNLMNSLSGRVAGLQISRSGSGAGGSVKVNLRGNRSVSGSNSPLYVVDGIPLAGSGATQANALEDAGRDGGDGISNLNPEDIESINVLKGAAASALYGSQAANGVVLITTKKGMKGVSKVNFSSNFTADMPMLLPEMTKFYKDESGSLVENANALTAEDFYQSGLTFVNAISATHGGDKTQLYFSYANTTAQGVLPTNEFSKNNFTVRQTGSLFDDRLTLSSSVNYIDQSAQNRPGVGTPYNAIASALLSPRRANISDMETYEVFDPNRNINVQNWAYTGDTQYLTDNPYWVLNRNMAEETRKRFIVAGTASWKFSEALSLRGRVSLDNTADVWERKVYASSNTVKASTNGAYYRDDYELSQAYGEAMLNYNKTFGDIAISAAVGTAIRTEDYNLKKVDSGNKGLTFPNFFSPAGLTSSKVVYSQYGKQVQSVFGTAQVGFKEMVYLDLTGRNDWSSTLPAENNSYFYPSVGLTAVVNKMVTLPDAISLAKVRGAYTVLGNDVPIGITNQNYTMNPVTGSPERAIVGPFADIVPELSSSIELGAELELYNGVFYVDASYYKTNTKNQLLRIDAPAGFAYSQQYINAGDVQNEGVEIALTAVPVSTGNLTWSTTLNFSRNVNTILALFEDSGEKTEFITDGSNAGYSLGVEKSGSFGDIYGFDYERDENGALVIGEDGLPNGTNTPVLLGNPNPDFILGWNNTLKVNNFTANILVDGKFGGEVMSFTQAIMDDRQTSQAWYDAQGSTVTIDGQEFDAEALMAKTAGRDGVTANYMYDATNVRLREVSLSYTFPEAGAFKDLTISAVGRNLFFFYNNAPYDPDITPSAGNGMQGLDFFGIPATRSVGMNVKFSF